MLTVDQYHEYYNNGYREKLYKNTIKFCECRHPIVVNLNKTLVKCSNPHCPKHMSFKAELMLKDLGVQGIGAATARDLILQNGLTNHMDILGLSPEQMPARNSGEVKMKFYYQLQKERKHTLSKVLRLFQIDDIADQTSDKLLEGFDSFEDFFNRFDTLPKIVDHFCKALKQKRTDHLVEMAYHLFCKEEELKHSEKYFDIIKSAEETFTVCMTGTITSLWSPNQSLSNRNHFLPLLNKKYETIMTFKSTSNVSEASVLLLDSTTGKRKINNAKDLNIPVMSFAQFYNYVRQSLGEGNEKYIIHTR